MGQGERIMYKAYAGEALPAGTPPLPEIRYQYRDGKTPDQESPGAKKSGKDPSSS
ncbi:MAG: hypothetical protein LBD78_04260 [Spirochaetaceae bacterium]|jgi:hypothetical protein|nr:hypothetical protein [Spirochaetaceae bacterium]